MNEAARTKTTTWMKASVWSVGLSLLAFAVYGWTLSRVAYPGESAMLIVNHLELNPFGTLAQPVWGLLARAWVAILPLHDPAFSLNLLSALCAAVSVGLLFSVVNRITHDRTTEEKHAFCRAQRVRFWSALSAALFFMCCVPLWMAATRAHFLTFDAAYILFCTRLYMTIWEKAKLRRLYWFAFFYGLGMAQSAAFILAAPFFGFYVLWRLWEVRQLDGRILLKATGYALLGISTLFLFAARYYFRPSYAWREMAGYWPLLWTLVRDHGTATIQIIRQMGWLLLLLTTALPWLAVVGIQKNADRTASGRIGSVLMHMVVLLMGGALLFNLPPSPLAILGAHYALVLPYLLVAVWWGYTVGYAYAVIGGSRERPPGWTHAHSVLLRRVWLGIVWVLLIVAAGRNATMADGRGAEPVNGLARSIVQHMGERTWLLSNGMLDPLVRIAAAAQEREIVILDPRLGRTRPYLRYLASLIDQPRLKGLVDLGMVPFLSEWLETDPHVTAQLAVLAAPNIWSETGRLAVPDAGFYFGTEGGDSEWDADALREAHRSLWRAVQTATGPDDPRPHTPYNQWAKGHASRLANDAGILFENAGHREDAAEFYAAARTLNAENISALLNGLSLATRHNQPNREDLQTELDTLLETKERLNLWALSAHYGYVRDPQAYVQQGMGWAASGRMRSAVAQVERAMDMVGRNPQLRHLLATMYLQSERAAEGEDLYHELLRENPEDQQALISLLRLSLSRGAIPEARAWLGRFRAAGGAVEQVRLEEIMLRILDGQEEGIAALLQAHVRAHPRDARAWATYLMWAQQQHDRDLMQRIVNQLVQVERPEELLLLVRANAEMTLGQLPAARETLIRILAANPSSTRALEQLIALDVAERNRDSARRHIEMLLGMDPGNPLGNYILGSLQYDQRDFALAETSYRRSLQRREMPEALSDLAWVLYLRGAYEEAYPLAQRAVEQNPRNANAWSTFGAVRMHLGDLEGAAEALHTATELNPLHPVIQLNLAELYERMGQPQQAREILDPILTNMGALPEEAAQRAARLSSTLSGR